MADFKATFVYERETKGAVRYLELEAPPRIGVLYVRKLALGSPYPRELEVTIAARAKLGVVK